MRPKRLKRALRPEEQEFLWELADQGTEEGKQSLADFDRMSVDASTVEDHIAMVARQERKVGFMQKLRKHLGGDNDNDN